MSLFQDLRDLFDRVAGGDESAVTKLVSATRRHPDEVRKVAEERRRRSPEAGGDPGRVVRRLSSAMPTRPIGDKRRAWTNYLQTEVVEPLRYIRARNADDVVNAVMRASELGEPVKAVGTGHSSSDITHTTGFLIDTTDLCGAVPLDAALLMPGQDGSRLRSYRAGTLVRDVVELAREDGLALPNMGGYDGQTIYGAIATATHGSGVGLGALCDAVVSLLLVDGRGHVVRVERSGPHAVTRPEGNPSQPDIDSQCDDLIQDDEVFFAAVVGLGCMGVVLEVTLELRDHYYLSETRHLDRWSSVRHLLSLSALAKSRHFEVLVNPYRKDGDHSCLVTRRSEVAGARETPSGHRNAIGTLIAMLPVADEAAVWFLNAFPAITPDAIEDALEVLSSDEPFVHRYDRVLTLGAINDQEAHAAEYAFPVSQAADVVDELLELTVATAERGQLYLSAPLSLRFVAPSPHFLAMQNGTEPVMMVEVPVLYGTYGSMTVVERFQELARRLGGRPHWGQLNTLSGACDALHEMYPRLDAWHLARNRLDPDRRFDSRFSRRCGL